MLNEPADCFITLPGGPGTFEELWDVASLEVLGMYGRSRPVCVVNTVRLLLVCFNGVDFTTVILVPQCDIILHHFLKIQLQLLYLYLLLFLCRPRTHLLHMHTYCLRTGTTMG